jgi:predicted amidophosphoribosyltransferase
VRTRPGITLSWAQTAALNPATPLCLGCGTELARLGSLRCPSCRALDTPIEPRLAQPRRAA